MLEVQNNFKVVFDNGVWVGLKRKKCRKIILNVCCVNWVIYDVMFNVGEVLDFEKYCVDIGNEMLVDIL